MQCFRPWGDSWPLTSRTNPSTYCPLTMWPSCLHYIYLMVCFQKLIKGLNVFFFINIDNLEICPFSAPSVGRLVPLCQQEVSRAVRQQHLSEVWTVEYAQDLLLLGGLLPETVWLAYHLGDWKTAVSLSLAYTSYCTDCFDFTRSV